MVVDRLAKNFALLTALLFISSTALADTNLTATTNFDGDTKGDLALYSSTDGSFTVRSSKDGTFAAVVIGETGSVPLRGDFDGDSRADKAVYNPSTATWKFLYASGHSKTIRFGSAGSIPLADNFLNTTCTDVAAYNPRSNSWSIRNCATGKAKTYNLGKAGDIALSGDIDCDGLADPVVFRRTTSEWIYRPTTNFSKFIKFKFGRGSDIPLIADLTGNGCANPTLYRPEGNFFIVADKKGKAIKKKQWGIPGDVPALVNIDNGAADFAVFRPSDNAYYITTDKGVFKRVPFEKPEPTYREVLPEIDFGGIDFDLGEGTADGGALQDLIGGIIGDLIGGMTPRSVNTAAPRTAEITPATSFIPLTYPKENATKIPGSYRGDTTSDFALVRNTADQKIWSVRHQDNTTSTYIYGMPSDQQLVPGDFDGDGAIEPTYVRATDDLLNWHTRSYYGGSKITQFGLKSDKPLVGDFDCDGKDDKAVARSDGTFLHWFIKLTTGGEVQSKLFGLATDQPFAADLDGNGCDELIVAQNQYGAMWWFAYSVKSKKQLTPVQWGLYGDELLGPMDFSGDGRADLVVSRPTAAGYRAFFIRKFSATSNWSNYIEFGLAGDIPLTGFFTGQNKAEVAVYRSGQNGGASNFYVRTTTGAVQTIPFGQGIDRVIRPDGHAAAPAKTNGVECDLVSDFFDGANSGVLWKPVSDSKGRPVIVLPASYWTEIESIAIYGREGNKVSTAVHRSCCGNGGRANFDVAASAGQLAQYSPLTVQFKLASGINECRIVKNANARED